MSKFLTDDERLDVSKELKEQLSFVQIAKVITQNLTSVAKVSGIRRETTLF